MDSTQLKASSNANKSKRVATLSGWLIEPSRTILDPARRRKARLLSVFLICLILMFLAVNFAYLLSVPNYHVSFTDMIGYAILALTYLLSRTRLTGLAVFVLLVIFPLNVFGNIFGGTSLNPEVTLSFLLPSFLLASIFTSALWTAIFWYRINLIVYLLPVLAPQQVAGLSVILGPLAVGVIIVALCVISIIHRDLIERDRQAELRKAYDNTLEGWSRALEIRDKKTQGHSQRVTELALQLGRTCGLRGEELEYLCRGALLHDIGKMAIPDAILTKKNIAGR